MQRFNNFSKPAILSLLVFIIAGIFFLLGTLQNFEYKANLRGSEEASTLSPESVLNNYQKRWEHNQRLVQSFFPEVSEMSSEGDATIKRQNYEIRLYSITQMLEYIKATFVVTISGSKTSQIYTVSKGQPLIEDCKLFEINQKSVKLQCGEQIYRFDLFGNNQQTVQI